MEEYYRKFHIYSVEPGSYGVFFFSAIVAKTADVIDVI
jgi:hypothetical protein